MVDGMWEDDGDSVALFGINDAVGCSEEVGTKLDVG